MHRRHCGARPAEMMGFRHATSHDHAADRLTGLVTIMASNVGTAYACSCAGPASARDQTARADIAFVGTATSVRTLGDDSRLYTVEVELAVKGEVPAAIEIEAGTFDGSCGVNVPLRQSIGFAPYPLRNETDDVVGAWSVDLCGGMVPASEMSAVVDQRLPQPTGRGPVAAIVVARTGPADAVAVDAIARPLGYVALDRPEGEYADIVGLATCPGGTRAAVLVLRSGDDGNLGGHGRSGCQLWVERSSRFDVARRGDRTRPARGRHRWRRPVGQQRRFTTVAPSRRHDDRASLRWGSAIR